MNGVMSASVSPGSSQRETSVTWTPMVMVPSGAAGARDAPARMPRATTAATTSERARISGPPVGAGGGDGGFVSVPERLPYRSQSHLDHWRTPFPHLIGGGRQT